MGPATLLIMPSRTKLKCSLLGVDDSLRRKKYSVHMKLSSPFAEHRAVSACGDGPPHANTSLRMQRTVQKTSLCMVLRTRNTSLCMRKRSSACGTRVSAYGDGPPHMGHGSPHAEAHVVRKTMRKCRSRLPYYYTTSVAS